MKGVPPCIQGVRSVVLTPLFFEAAPGPCVSVGGYTVCLETFHVSHDGTSAGFDLFHHHSVWHKVYGPETFE